MPLWDNLPNARHIDRLIESSSKEGDIHYEPALEDYMDARLSALQIVEGTDAKEIYLTALDVLWDAMLVQHNRSMTTYYSFRNAVLALIAWDECGYLLDEKPEHVLLLAGLGIDAAILMRPVCLLLTKETRND